MVEHSNCRPRREPTRNDPPPFRSSPPFDIVSGPHLRHDTVDEFIAWSAAVPVSQVEVVRQRIAKSRVDEKLVDTLLETLWKLPVLDVGRHRILLSILGELRSDRAVASLEKFIWHERELTPVLPHTGQPSPCMFESSGTELLQARAAEMLSYIASDSSAKAVLRIIRDHPKLLVRISAIDAHLFNHDDSHEVAEELRKLVRSSDRHCVGLPRKVRGGDVEQFERAVFAWYESNPEHRPPRPKQNLEAGNPPQPRSWFKPASVRAQQESHADSHATDQRNKNEV